MFLATNSKNMKKLALILLLSLLFLNGCINKSSDQNSKEIADEWKDLYQVAQKKISSLEEQCQQQDIKDYVSPKLPVLELFPVILANNEIALFVKVPEGQSACIWREFSDSFATGANILTTESIINGNLHTYKCNSDISLSVYCQDKYGGDYEVKGVNVKDFDCEKIVLDTIKSQK